MQPKMPRRESVPVVEVMKHGSRRPLHALTSIRFFAAMYVVLFHYRLQEWFSNFPFLRNFFLSGYTGVTLFFSLSGFILAYNYPQVRDRRDFWVSRFARIYPAYILAVIVWLALMLSHSQTRHTPHLPQIFLANVFLLQSWWSPWATVINPVGWTLSVEALFYLVFPFAVEWCRRATRVQIAFFFSIYLAWVLLPLLLQHPAVDSPSPAYWIASQTDSYLPALRLGTFLIGVLTGIYYNRCPHAPLWVLPASLAGSILLLVWAPTTYGRPLKTMLLSYAYSALLYALANIEWAPLTNRWMLMGGEISYSIYLLQLIVPRILNHLFAQAAPHWYLFRSELAGIPFLIATAYLNFRFVEVPARKWIRSALRRSQSDSLA